MYPISKARAPIENPLEPLKTCWLSRLGSQSKGSSLSGKHSSGWCPRNSAKFALLWPPVASTRKHDPLCLKKPTSIEMGFSFNLFETSETKPIFLNPTTSTELGFSFNYLKPLKPRFQIPTTSIELGFSSQTNISISVCKPTNVSTQVLQRRKRSSVHSKKQTTKNLNLFSKMKKPV